MTPKLLLLLLLPVLIGAADQPSQQSRPDRDSQSEDACDATESASCSGPIRALADDVQVSHLGAKQAIFLRALPLVKAAGCANGAEGLDCILGKMYQWGTGYGDDKDGTVGRASSMLTYGEFLPTAFARLLAGSGLIDIPAGLDDTFIDLGSGTGKLPVAATLLGIPFTAGVELARHRHDIGVVALKALSQVGGAVEESDGGAKVTWTLNDSLLSLQAGSILDMQLSTFTIVYAASLCFPEDVMQALADHLRVQLKPGAVFWTLKELPAGRHPGLTRVRQVPGAASWDSQAKVVVYMRVPEIKLPQLQAVGGQGQAGSTMRDKDRFSAWAVQLLAAARLELIRLLESCGSAAASGNESGAAANQVRLRQADFSRAAAAFGSAAPAAGQRLLHAFATRGSRTDEDRCGCRQAEASQEHSVSDIKLLERSFSDIDMLELLGHGAFPEEEAAVTTCMSTSRSCTLADVFADRVYLELRARTKCRSPNAPRSCGLHSPPGTLAKDTQLERGHLCMRLSDGRTLLQVAMMGKAPEIGELILKGAGPGALLCSDQDGRAALHFVADHGAGEALTWLGQQVAALPPAFADEVLGQRDLTGRTPADLAKIRGTLSALEVAVTHQATVTDVSS